MTGQWTLIRPRYDKAETALREREAFKSWHRLARVPRTAAGM